MTPKLSVKIRDFRVMLRDNGLDRIRQRGSHEYWKHPTDRDRRLSLPVHGDEISGGQVREFFRKAGLPWKGVDADVTKEAKIVTTSQAVLPTSVPSPELSAPSPSEFSELQRLEVASLALDCGAEHAAGKFGVDVVDVKAWLVEFSGKVEKVPEGKRSRVGRPPLKNITGQYRIMTTEKAAEMVEEWLSDDPPTIQDLADRYDCGWRTASSVVKGGHHRLSPGSVAALRRRDKAPRREATAKPTVPEAAISGLVELVVDGVPLETAAKRAGISAALAARVVVQHEGTTVAQRRALARRAEQALSEAETTVAPVECSDALACERLKVQNLQERNECLADQVDDLKRRLASYSV